MGYHYTIVDIPGKTNVWADLLSRRGSRLPCIRSIAKLPLLISHLRETPFQWPTLTVIAEAQMSHVETTKVQLVSI
jgi:hypothetical protein